MQITGRQTKMKNDEAKAKIESAKATARMARLATLIEKAKRFAEDNYELGFSVFVECNDEEDWVKEVTDHDGKLLSWSQVKASMKDYVEMRKEIESTAY